MTHPLSPRRKRWGLAALAAAALGAPLLATATGASPAVGAGPGDPSITLTAPDSVTAQNYGGGIYSDLGFRLEVREAALEIWTTRASDYESAPTAVAKLPNGDVTLPDQKRVGMLDNFMKITLVDRNDPDATPVTKRRGVCFGESSERIDPTADFRNSYPRTCWYNPYALGAVQGVPAGWASSIFGYETRLRVKPGEYDLTVAITKAYADALDLSAEERTATTVLTVVEGNDCRGCRDGHTNPRLQPNRHEPDPSGGIGAVEDLPEGTPLPDLRSLPAFGIQLNRKGTQLQFSANVWNNGNSPLVVDGFRRSGEDIMDAYQYFLDEDGNQIAYEQVGTMEWDPAPTHQHWHFTDFATYELLNADLTRAVRSGKEAFCLANTDAVDLTGEGAEWSAYEDDLGSVCGGYETRSIREVLSAGWGDTYAQFRAGQSFPVKNLADGIYYIRVLANPEDTLLEADTTNNEALRKVRLWTNKAGERRVRVAPVGLVDESQGIYYRR
ncbi:lysyl oxidase family protein [Nocardioides stalactiti]|uniref:lysyl oxidase family protein n=1 Tax=Nocardioides stalactiti TaxID=2755356 RepID=UPI0016019BEC|nr:lysyl oxidase family protein [Nocardioides stalactiti]